MSQMYNPLHPGEIVRDALFTDTELTVTDAAKLLKVSRSALSRLLNGQAGISADMAHRLALFLDTSPDMWMNVQKDYDLWIAGKKNKTLKIIPLRKLKKQRKAA